MNLGAVCYLDFSLSSLASSPSPVLRAFLFSLHKHLLASLPAAPAAPKEDREIWAGASLLSGSVCGRAASALTASLPGSCFSGTLSQ